MGEAVETRFATSGELDMETSVAINLRTLWKPNELRRLYIYCGVIFTLSLYLLYLRSEHAPIMVVLSVLLMGLFIYLPINVKKSSTVRFHETAPDGKLAYTSSFCEDKLLLVNHTNGGSGELLLSQVKKVVAVKDVWALISKGNMIYPVFASQLSETDQRSVLDLLKQNNPKIKIQISKK